MIFFFPERRNRKLKSESINDVLQKLQEDHCGSYGCSKGPGGGGGNRELTQAHHTRWDIVGHHEGFDFYSEQSGKELGEFK